MKPAFRDTDIDAERFFGVEGAYTERITVVRATQKDGTERLLTTKPGELDGVGLVETNPWARSPAPRVPRIRPEPEGPTVAFWIVAGIVAAALAVWAWRTFA